jgi:hypothetical protein
MLPQRLHASGLKYKRSIEDERHMLLDRSGYSWFDIGQSKAGLYEWSSYYQVYQQVAGAGWNQVDGSSGNVDADVWDTTASTWTWWVTRGDYDATFMGPETQWSTAHWCQA